MCPSVAIVAPYRQRYFAFPIENRGVDLDGVPPEIIRVYSHDSQVIVTQPWVWRGQGVVPVRTPNDVIALPGLAVELLAILRIPSPQIVLEVVVPDVRYVNRRQLHLHWRRGTPLAS